MAGRYALLIGVGRYDDTSLNGLSKSTSDVVELGSVLAHPDLGDFHVEKLLDPTNLEAVSAIERFFEQRDKEDLLVLYFSGHGIKNFRQNKLYLAASNTSNRLLLSSSINVSTLREIMDLSGAKRQVVILDCCYSGAFLGKGATVSSEVDTGGDFDAQGFGRIVLSASGSSEIAFEGDPTSPTSLFTQYVIEGIQTGKADRNNDGIITVDELYNYVHERVRSENRNQNPQFSNLHGEGNSIRIARAGATSPPSRNHWVAWRPWITRLRTVIREARRSFLKASVRNMVWISMLSSSAVGVLAWQLLLRTTLYQGHIRLEDARTKNGYDNECGFVFSQGKMVGWRSGQADVLIGEDDANTDGPPQLFIQYRFEAKPGNWDDNAFGGIREMPDVSLDQVKNAPSTGYNPKWMPATLGRVYVIRTRDGQHFAKIRITEIERRHVSFDYVYQPNRSGVF